MIVCHCKNITDTDIDAAIDWMRRSDAEALITPGKVYRALGKSADCGGCMALFLETMRRNPKLEIPAGPVTVTGDLSEGDGTCRETKRSSTI